VQAGAYDAATAYVAFDRHTVGDMAPYVYVTTDYGKTWRALASPAATKGINGFAHVIKEDIVDPNLLFLGTEFGLWVSVDAGEHWAQFKGGQLPNVPVRDLVIQARDNDLVLATHGRGIWIVDDISPLRALNARLLAADASFIAARPVQQRIEANGGWANGAAAFVGANPAAGAVITYYQRTRHLFGKLKLEVLDEHGTVIDELPASARRGLNRVVWTMHLRPPHVPPAVQLAFAGTQGPRVLPGTYTIRMQKNGAVLEFPLNVGLDARVGWNAADRRAQYEAAMQVYGLFGDEADLFGRIAALREQVAAALERHAGKDPLHAKLTAFDAKLDAVRKQIVATTEGGAITGEERLREHTDQLYGAIGSWEGPPSQDQLANIAALRRQYEDIAAEFSAVAATSLPALNAALRGAGSAPVTLPATASRVDDEPFESGGSLTGEGRADADGVLGVELPQHLRLWN
jgi:hypothetical protein